MNNSSYLSAVRSDHYGVKLLLTMFTLLLVLAVTSYYLIQNYYSRSFLAFDFKSEPIYFLTSKTNRRMYERNGMDYTTYLDRIGKFQTMCRQNGFSPETVTAEGLKDLPDSSILIALDMMSLSSDEMEEIDRFVRRG